jgi:uncharacterized membrane protein YjjP (DUF1212 family)
MPEESTAPSIAESTGRGALDLAIRCGEVIFASGASAEDATATMLAVTRAYGLKGCEADVTHTVITLTWDDPASSDTIVRSRNVKYRTIDYTRLTNTSTLIGELLHEPLPLAEARIRVNTIITAKPIYPWPVRRVGWSLVGAGAAFLLGGGPLVVAAAFVATFFVDLLTRMLAKTRMSVFYQNLAGGAVGPLVAAVVHFLDPAASSSLVVVATIIMLLAGVTSFGAVQDVLSGFYVTGTARVLEALLITGGLVAGVAGTTMYSISHRTWPRRSPTFRCFWSRPSSSSSVSRSPSKFRHERSGRSASWASWATWSTPRVWRRTSASAGPLAQPPSLSASCPPWLRSSCALRRCRSSSRR